MYDEKNCYSARSTNCSPTQLAIDYRIFFSQAKGIVEDSTNVCKVNAMLT